jgi:hypothetical protein
MGHPTYMYRLNEGKVESQVFDSDSVPDGWVDSPAKVGEKEEPKVVVKKKHGNRA